MTDQRQARVLCEETRLRSDKSKDGGVRGTCRDGAGSGFWPAKWRAHGKCRAPQCQDTASREP